MPMTVLSELSVALEQATEGYAVAGDEEAVAESEYLRVMHRAYAQLGGAETTKKLRAQGQALDEHEIWLAKKAVRFAMWNKCESLRARMSAAQSNQRFIRDQT